MADLKRVQFGLFDFDPETGELRKDGRPIRLAAQPARALAALVQNPGEIVTRESLQQMIWGSETHVDYERGLNFCVAQIRSALGDSPDSPRYVKTIPKRGYQFVAPVTVPPSEPVPVAEVSPVKSSPRWIALAVILLILTGLSTWLAFRNYASTGVAVTRFDNETGDAQFQSFADGLTDSVVAEMTQAAPQFGIIGNAATLRLPRNQRDLKSIAGQLGARYVIIGQVQGSAQQLRVLVHLIRMPDQKHLLVNRWEGAAANLLNVQTEISRKVAVDFPQRIKTDSALQVSAQR